MLLLRPHVGHQLIREWINLNWSFIYTWAQKFYTHGSRFSVIVRSPIYTQPCPPHIASAWHICLDKRFCLLTLLVHEYHGLVFRGRERVQTVQQILNELIHWEWIILCLWAVSVDQAERDRFTEKQQRARHPEPSSTNRGFENKCCCCCGGVWLSGPFYDLLLLPGAILQIKAISLLRSVCAAWYTGEANKLACRAALRLARTTSTKAY